MAGKAVHWADSMLGQNSELQPKGTEAQLRNWRITTSMTVGLTSSTPAGGSAACGCGAAERLRTERKQTIAQDDSATDLQGIQQADQQLADAAQLLWEAPGL